MPFPATVAALRALDEALDTPRRPGVQLGNWRWRVRQQLTGLRELLVMEAYAGADGWGGGSGAAPSERGEVLAALARYSREVLEAPDPERLRNELKRLCSQVGRHLSLTPMSGVEDGT